jgi:hypothetical protein
VAANRDLRYTIMEVGGGVAKVAGSTTVLGLALGPIGRLVEGIVRVGSVVAYASSSNYKSIVAVLNDMTPEDPSSAPSSPGSAWMRAASSSTLPSAAALPWLWSHSMKTRSSGSSRQPSRRPRPF